MEPQKRRLLIVDDEPAVLSSVSLVLESKGYEVLQAECGMVALHRLIERQESVACIVLDYRLPDINGLEVLQRLRNAGLRSPVVLCSGFSIGKHDPEEFNYWPEAFLGKPYQVDLLCEKIETVCNNR